MDDPYPVPLSYKSTEVMDPFTIGVSVMEVSSVPIVANLKSTTIGG